jgi:hypothetical protein
MWDAAKRYDFRGKFKRHIATFSITPPFGSRGQGDVPFIAASLGAACNPSQTRLKSTASHQVKT